MLLALPVLFVVWANSHGSFIIGLGFLAIVLLGRVIEAARASERGVLRSVWRDAQVRRLSLTLVLCGAAACINPHGPMLFAYTMNMAHHPAVAMIAEWQPLGAHPMPLLVATPFLATMLFVGVTLWLSPRSASPTQAMLLILLGAGACCQQRLMIWLAMTALWVAAPHWAAIIQQRAARRRLWVSVPSLRKTMVAIAIGFVASMWTPTMSWIIAGSPPALSGSVSPGTPWEVARQLRPRTMRRRNGPPSYRRSSKPVTRTADSPAPCSPPRRWATT